MSDDHFTPLNDEGGNKIGAFEALRHLVLLVLTFLTATVAGILMPFGPIPLLAPENSPVVTDANQFFWSIPAIYSETVGVALRLLLTDDRILLSALCFSVPLLFILVCHEMGHYVACRIYKVRVTLPYFLPMPPLLSPAGTLGAFIKIKSPLPSRKATFDIGVAGPIAGFLAVIPVIVIGLMTMEPIPSGSLIEPGSLYFSDPLLTHLIGWTLGKNPSSGVMNPFLAAGWLGLLITSLNLIPSGQLDGGHAVYSVFGERVHFWTGRIAFVAMLSLSMVGWYLFEVPGAILFTILLAVMMRARHPKPLDDSALDRKRLVVAVVTAVVFLLSFTPFPIKIIP